MTKAVAGPELAKAKAQHADNDSLWAQMRARAAKLMRAMAAFQAKMRVQALTGRPVSLADLGKYNLRLREFAELVSRGMAFADLLARVRVVRDLRAEDQDADRALRTRRRFTVYRRIADELPDYLNQPFLEAILAFAAREPVVAETAELVAEAYQRQQFAIAKTSDQQLARQVQATIQAALNQGTGIGDLMALFRERIDAGNVDAYAENVFRTNLSTAQNAGRIRMAADPELQGFLVAWEYFARLDDATRSNHEAMHGHRASLNAPVWNVWAPPNGYQCRCGLLEMTRVRAEQLGRLDAQGSFKDDPFPSVLPDEGFRQSPAGAIYGA